MATNKIDTKNINALRVLGVDMINKAKSGHPGIVLGAAPILYTLFTRFINIDPENPEWWNRDRFILSAGHGSALLYALYHLCGYAISMEDLKSFRQLGSLTPGHPEYRHTPGVEMTTGPLGQGIATACGMAFAQNFMSERFDKTSYPICNHKTYVLCGDGDLQEGIAQEAMSLAGHLKFDNLVLLYDSNDIQLDGPVALDNTENVKQKTEAMGWKYFFVADGNDVEEIASAIELANKTEGPVIIEIKTKIGFGAPNEGTNAVHGAPIGEENAKLLRDALDYHNEPFVVDKSVYDFFLHSVKERGVIAEVKWSHLFDGYAHDYPELCAEYEKFNYNSYEINKAKHPTWEVGQIESTRKIVGKLIDFYSIDLPNIVGGSADLTPSTFVHGANGDYEASNRVGRNIKFGVREHAMGAMINGINLHGGLRGFCAGFFVFSDYMKPAIRQAAIMGIPSIFIFSHDSVCVGEDGPTHQPIEHFAMFRSIPNLNVIRPADAHEAIGACSIAFESKTTPTIITTSRQGLPVLKRTDEELVKKGAYVVYDPNVELDGILISCGSELAIALDTAAELQKYNINVRVVSMPSMFLFDMQPAEYKESVLPSNVKKRLAIEMGASMPWYKYASNVFGIDRFGVSAPIKHIHEYFGFTPENLAKVFKDIK